MFQRKNSIFTHNNRLASDEVCSHKITIVSYKMKVVGGGMVRQGLLY